MTLAGAMGRLSSLLAAPVLTRTLGPEPYGVVSLIWTVISLATTLSVQIIEFPYLRYCAGVENARAAAIERLCWRGSVAAASVFGLVAASVWGLALSKKAGLPATFAFIVGLGVLLISLQTMSQARVRLRGAYSRVALSVAAGAILSSALSIVLALYWRADAWALLTGTMAGVLLGIALLGLPNARVFWTSSGLRLSEKVDIVWIGLPGVVTGPLHWVINSSDRWFLGIYRSQEELGLYAFASSIGLIGLVVNSSLAFTWFPEAAATHAQQPDEARKLLGREWARLVTILLITWLAVVSAGGDVIRLCADRKFHAGAQYIPWIASGTAFYGMASVAATGLFVAEHMTPLAAWWLLGAGCDVLLNALLVPPIGAQGAALASCASYGLIAAGVLWSSHRSYPIVVPWARLSLVVVLALTAGIFLVSPWHERPLWSLLAKLPAGLGVALALLYIVAPEWLRRGFDMRFRYAV